MALSPISSTADWTDEIADAIVDEMRGEVSIVIPGKPGKINPRTDQREGGSPDIELITERKARIQHRSSWKERSGASEWSVQRPYLFQIIVTPDDPPTEKGQVIRVTDGGDQPALTSASFQVAFATQSTPTLRSIYAVAENRGAL